MVFVTQQGGEDLKKVDLEDVNRYYAIKVIIYENERGRGPVQSIEAYASPIFSFN